MSGPIKGDSLTGGRRYQKSVDGNCSSVLVLQVQVNRWLPGTETKPYGRWITEWRDATPEDVNTNEVVS